MRRWGAKPRAPLCTQRRGHRACKASDWDGIYVGRRKGKDLVRLSDLEPLLGADVAPSPMLNQPSARASPSVESIELGPVWIT